MSRYVLIDYLHLAHKCMGVPPLKATVTIGGEVRVIDTTIPSYTIKSVFNYGGKGEFYTGVFLDSGSSYRKEYFSRKDTDTVDGTGYKGNRSGRQNAFYEGVDLAVNLMYNGKVSLYRVEGYEADDLIASVVAKIKSEDTKTPIDIITNDSDLLPLVDDQVSVYMRSTREFAVDGAPTRRLYYQVTPQSWDDYFYYASAYRDYLIPYNSILLFKLIKGDKSDNIAGAVKGLGAKKYSLLMERMIQDGVDFPNIFRYGVDFDEVMRPILESYFKVEEVDYMKFIYEGINLRFKNLVLPKKIELGFLQEALSPVKINLIRV